MRKCSLNEALMMSYVSSGVKLGCPTEPQLAALSSDSQ